MRPIKKQGLRPVALLLPVLVMIVTACTGSNPSFAAGNEAISRISVAEARQHSLTGQALLICAYEDPRCRNIMLEGALLLSELKAQIPDIAKDKELIFYCA